MGQDSEAAAELVATIRGEHVPMKTWFNGSSPDAVALRAKYGAYPALWKEVLNWPGWKEARKAYLKSTQTNESSSSTTASVPRKRRSRWGAAAPEDTNGGSSSGRAGTEPAAKRRSRWAHDAPQQPRWQQGPPPSSHYGPAGSPGLVLPGMPTNLSGKQREEMLKLQARLREINERMANLERDAARVDQLPRGHRDRSPSPPPVYGADGKRKNTRAVRWRERFSAERHEVLDRLMNLNPATRQSGLYKRKRTKKIRIPVDEHPTYNFIGLIIGPRGKTQKELEAKTGCKIAIRGRGSVKEGARGRRDGKVMEGDDEPLHVVITGDDQQSVDAATDMVEQMLIVIDDEKNVHKQQQLRELALLNGTLKEEEYCQICAERGHRSFECPRRFAMNKTAVAVKCAICGDTSHPTRDCTQKPTDQNNKQELDSEFMSFMAEVDGKKAQKLGTAAGASPAAPGATPAITKPGEGQSGGAPPAPTGLPPPPPNTASGGAGGAAPPPPPSGLPQPPIPAAGANYYGNQQQQQQPAYNYGNQQQQHYGQNYQQNYYQPQQQQAQPPYHQQQAQQAQPGQEAAAWDYRSYYGQGGSGGDQSGAGGFNWWS